MLARFLIRRSVQAVVVCVGVSFLTFGLMYLLPADPVAAIAGVKVSPETAQRIRHELGLDRPFIVQYGMYVARLMRGDLGRSYVTQQAVAEAIAQRILPTALLAVAAWSIAIVAGALLTCLAVLRPWWARVAFAFSTSFLAIPPFWLGLALLYVFAFLVPIFPLGGFSLKGAILPALALSAGLAATYVRVLEANLREVLDQPYVQAARAKGLTERRVVIVHGLRNAVLPVFTLVSLDLAGLLGGVTLTETVFHWPGLGRLAVEAVFNQDIPMLMGVVLVTTAILVVMNLVTDLLYAVIDPRLRQSGGESWR